MTKQPDATERLKNSVSATEAAGTLGMTYRWFLKEYIDKRKIDYFKIGSEYRINKDDLNAFIENRHIKAE